MRLELNEDRGLLVAFEGPDGSGKTTQRKLFKDWLRGRGDEAVVTKWSSSPYYKPIIKSKKAEKSLGAEEFAVLHALVFRYRYTNETLPALQAGKTVLADRYVFTGVDSLSGLQSREDFVRIDNENRGRAERRILQRRATSP